MLLERRHKNAVVNQLPKLCSKRQTVQPCGQLNNTNYFLGPCTRHSINKDNLTGPYGVYVNGVQLQ